MLPLLKLKLAEVVKDVAPLVGTVSLLQILFVHAPLGLFLQFLGGSLLSGLPMKVSMGAFRFVVDFQIVALGLGLAPLIGVLGALLPVLRVSRLKIVDALRAS